MCVEGCGYNDEIMETIQPLLSELRLHSEIIAIILFGSVTHGKVRGDSDIDISIVTRSNVPDSTRMELLSYGSDKIDIHLFLDLPLTIRMRVIREGELLFCSDLLSFHRIKIDTVRQYLDFSPFIRRHSLHAMGINQ